MLKHTAPALAALDSLKYCSPGAPCSCSWSPTATGCLRTPQPEGQGLRALLISLGRVLSPLAVFPVHVSWWGEGVLQESGSGLPPPQCSSFLAPWELGPPLC